MLLTFKSYCQTNGPIVPSTGEIKLIGDNKCIVPIELIRKANAKLIERKGFAKIIAQQDTIIRLHKFEIKQYSEIVIDMQNRIVDANKVNEDLHYAIEQQRKRTKTWMYVSGGAVAATILILLVK